MVGSLGAGMVASVPSYLLPGLHNARDRTVDWVGRVLNTVKSRALQFIPGSQEGNDLGLGLVVTLALSVKLQLGILISLER